MERRILEISAKYPYFVYEEEGMIELSRAQGYHVLIACITSENTDSCTFHERLGFKPVAQYDEVGWKFERWGRAQGL